MSPYHYFLSTPYHWHLAKTRKECEKYARGVAKDFRSNSILGQHILVKVGQPFELPRTYDIVGYLPALPPEKLQILSYCELWFTPSKQCAELFVAVEPKKEFI